MHVCSCGFGTDDTGRTGVALTGVADWATIPVAFANGDGTWTVTNQLAGDFPAWAASPGATAIPI